VAELRRLPRQLLHHRDLLGQSWSSYWHNGFIFANDINRGLDVFSLDHPSVAGAATLDRNNPQLQERLFG
jgi:hypothetical protein